MHPEKASSQRVLAQTMSLLRWPGDNLGSITSFACPKKPLASIRPLAMGQYARIQIRAARAASRACLAARTAGAARLQANQVGKARSRAGMDSTRTRCEFIASA